VRIPFVGAVVLYTLDNSNSAAIVTNTESGNVCLVVFSKWGHEVRFIDFVQYGWGSPIEETPPPPPPPEDEGYDVSLPPNPNG